MNDIFEKTKIRQIRRTNSWNKIHKKMNDAKGIIRDRHNKYLIQPHRLNKRNVFNCGDPSCIFCMNPRKSFGEITFQEKKFLQEPIDYFGTDDGYYE